MQNDLESADEFCAASAFLNSGGLDCVLPNLRRILEAEGAVRVVHGADFRITDPQAINKLLDLNERFLKMEYRVHIGWGLTTSHRFHPKLYIWTADYNSYTAVVGSSNLTLGGLVNNTEVNTVMRGEIFEGPIAQCLDIFQRLFAQPHLIEPDRVFLAKYQELHDHARELPFDSAPIGDMQKLYRELEELLRLPRYDWQPRTQLEFMVKALQNLEIDTPDPNLLGDSGANYMHLRAIYTEATRLAKDSGKSYDWGTLNNSWRRVLNTDIPTGTLVGRYFVREAMGSGRYRLTEEGRAFVG